jgi:DNA-damage-inducible protein D
LNKLYKKVPYKTGEKSVELLMHLKHNCLNRYANRAMIACETSGHRVTDDFPEVRKIVEAAKAFLL